MSMICRLASRRIAPQLIYGIKPEFTSLARHVTLKASPYKPPADEDYDERNMKLNRPQSPHLSIIALQLQSNLSISHRITGATLAGYTFLLGAGALVLPHKISYYLDVLQEMHPSSITLLGLKFILAFPFCYHFCNGIRHLVWDMGKFLTLQGVYNTGYLMLGSASLVTLLLCAL